MIVANIAGTIPKPNKIIAGIKYTKLGIVCIASKIGFINRSNRLLYAIKTPSGMPIIKEIKTEAIIIANVDIIKSKYPKPPIIKISTLNVTPVHRLIIRQANRKMTAINAHQGNHNKKDANS